jgi:NADP-reducing hydrogenase subunit HndC
MMGSGGLIVMDDTKCMVSLAKFYLEFTVKESCGKCTPCRIGTKRMHEILERLCAGEGSEYDIYKLEKLAVNIKKSSVCGLGQSAPNPVISTLKYFRDEFRGHAVLKECATHECKALSKIMINEELCKGCGLCQRNCPVGAIEGEDRNKRVINQEKCIKCGTCMTKCPFNAIK